MAKITIEDSSESSGTEHKMPTELLLRLFNVVAAAFDRLGEDAKSYVEVIKISPLTMTDLVQFIQVKIVISCKEPFSEEKIRIERSFELFIHDNLEDFLPQRIVVNFQEALSLKATSFRKASEGFCATLSLLGARESELGNDKRCRVCGTIRELCKKDEQPVCPRCNPTPKPDLFAVKDAPNCPNCGHVTVPNGNVYKCRNCGESVGTH